MQFVLSFVFEIEWSLITGFSKFTLKYGMWELQDKRNSVAEVHVLAQYDLKIP